MSLSQCHVSVQHPTDVFVCCRFHGSDYRVTTLPGKSWNLVRSFSRPGKSRKTAKVMESHEKSLKVMEKDDDVLEFFCKNALEFLCL